LTARGGVCYKKRLMGWWPFHRTEVPISFRQRLADLEDRQEKLEKGCKSIELEWENVYDKVVTATAKLNARHRALKGVQDDENLPQTTNGNPPAVEEFGYHARLSGARKRLGGAWR